MSNQCAATFIAAVPDSSRRLNRTHVILGSSLLLAALGCGGGPVYYPMGPGFGYGGGYGYGYGGGYISTAAGHGGLGSSGNGSAVGQAQITAPSGVAVDPSGNIYIADSASNTIRRVAAGTGAVATYAGRATTGSATGFAMRGYAGDNGPALNAEFNHPSALALDSSNNLYVADQANNVIRRISASTGLVTTVAGNANATQGLLGDNGPAIAAGLNHPSGVAFDPSGNLYIADTNNNRIREVVLATGIITTVAGTGNPGYAGDGQAATSAQLYHPAGVAVDGKGDIYVADSANNAIRKVSPAGAISTVAGTGTIGSAGDKGPATQAQLNNPLGIMLDAGGDLFISDSGNMTVREVVSQTGAITTIAGDGQQGYAGDGAISSNAELNAPSATALDSAQSLYVADTGNGAIRKVLPSPKPQP